VTISWVVLFVAGVLLEIEFVLFCVLGTTVVVFFLGAVANLTTTLKKLVGTF
jgi:hypothetical protein